jgi:hypothetical protein
MGRNFIWGRLAIAVSLLATSTVLLAPSAGAASTGTIAGTVTDSSGTPLDGICVYTRASGSFGFEPLRATTHSGGTYSFTESPGFYFVIFEDCNVPGFYARTAYGATSTNGSGTAVRVVAGEQTTANAALVAGGYVSGTAAGGDGDTEEWTCVDAVNAETGAERRTLTDASGFYDFVGLPPGSWKIGFAQRGLTNSLGVYCPSRFIPEWNAGQRTRELATPVAVAQLQAVEVNATLEVVQPADFSGDGRSDVAVYRPGAGAWFAQGGIATGWGTTGDVAVPADYNGDGITEVAVFRPSDQTWHVQPSASFPNGLSTQWGVPGDVPVPADYDGDGRDEVAVFRPSDQTWYSRNGLAAQWGVSGDVPVPADYDGDGIVDVAVYRPSDQTWYVQYGLATQWGVPGDVPVPFDFDGDGRDEVAVYRPSDQTWYSQASGLATQWGVDGDLAVPGDYDGDGRDDVAVHRPEDQTWYVQGGSSTQWGAPGDVPVILPPALYQFFSAA